MLFIHIFKLWIVCGLGKKEIDFLDLEICWLDVSHFGLFDLCFLLGRDGLFQFLLSWFWSWSGFQFFGFDLLHRRKFGDIELIAEQVDLVLDFEWGDIAIL